MSDIVDDSFKEQQTQEDFINLKALGIQLSINFVCCIAIFAVFCWLRPRYPLIYSPKSNLSRYDIRRPPTLKNGWFDWIMPIVRMKDDALIDHIGFDAYIFLYFTRLLRQIIIVLTLLSLFVFLPINIVATYNTGDWPPIPGLDFMSISAINYHSGKESHSPNYLWFWSPTIASWLVSILVLSQFYMASENFLRFRLKYYIERDKKYRQLKPSFSPTELLQYRKQDLLSRTLLVHLNNTSSEEADRNKSSGLRESSELLACINTSMEQTVTCQHVYIGKYNPRLYMLVDDYNSTIKKLEYALNQHSLKSRDRPTIRQGWRLKKIDAINFYTEKALILEKAIQKNRSSFRLQNCHYVWALFKDTYTAHRACVALSANNTMIRHVQVAPQPQDVVWSNMNIDNNTARLKRWYGHTLFISTMFVWCIPFSLLAVVSNMINFIRLFPQSDRIVHDNDLVLGVVQSYFTPCVTVLLQIKVPQAMRYISTQQAYLKKTTIESKTLIKLYLFFVINNVFIFTLVNIMVGILGQITALNIVGTLQTKDIAPYIVQIAKNMTDVSSFWIDYVCFRAVGASFELLRVVPLFRFMAKKSQVPLYHYFSFARNYGLVVSFFTAVLVYSVAAPIVLPFALVYFVMISLAYKYKLVYVYVTETETHGRMWVLLCRLMTSALIVFQAMMILILSLKSGMQQTYTLIPLPIITAILGWIYTRYLDRHNTVESWLKLTRHMNALSPAIEQEVEEDDASLLNVMYRDDTLCAPLKMLELEQQEEWVKDVYRDDPQWQRIRNTLFFSDKKCSESSRKDPTVLIIPTSPSSEELNIVVQNNEKVDIVPMHPCLPQEEPSAPPLPTYRDVIASTSSPVITSRRHSL